MLANIFVNVIDMMTNIIIFLIRNVSFFLNKERIRMLVVNINNSNLIAWVGEINKYFLEKKKKKKKKYKSKKQSFYPRASKIMMMTMMHGLGLKNFPHNIKGGVGVGDGL
jgi:hypothetical protein